MRAQLHAVEYRSPELIIYENKRDHPAVILRGWQKEFIRQALEMTPYEAFFSSDEEDDEGDTQTTQTTLDNAMHIEGLFTGKPTIGKHLQPFGKWRTKQNEARVFFLEPHT